MLQLPPESASAVLVEGGAKDSRWGVMPMAAIRLRSVGESLESTSPMVARLVSHQRMGLCSYWSIAGVCS